MGLYARVCNHPPGGTAVAGTGVGRAQPGRQKIDACRKAADEKDASAVGCIGIVTDPCIAAAKGKELRCR